MKEIKRSIEGWEPRARVDEITMDVDDDSRAMYFKQTKYGMYVRMALVCDTDTMKKIVEVIKNSGILEV